MIYLDHAATSPPRREVLEAVWPYLTSVTGNPSSAHEAGRAARAGLDAARSGVAQVLGCRPGEVVFTGGGTEADNLAVTGIAGADPHRRRVVVSAIEHPAVLETARALVQRGFRVDEVGVDGFGVVDLEQLERLVDDGTALVSVMYANNEVGTVQPLAEVSRICRAHGVPLHTDAVQAAGHLPLDTGELGVDALSVSAHKFGGLRGSGALFVRGAVPLEPLLHGGGQEQGRRSGTVDVAGAVGTAVALGLAEAAREEESARLRALRDRLVAGVLDAVPGARLTGHPVRRLPHHASFCFAGVGGETVLLELEAAGIACSSGSACSAGSEDASHVLLATGLDADTARTAVRFSMGPSTTEADVEAVLRALPLAVRAAGRA
ncbi:cysteine desulfurase [Paenibacillus sp. TRM 82003]|uniref:cysteine desulfurase family protein n=1 Tax=Kineococcus sp. TRM81007 TaxID=2925831 RepID=UPI001F56601A|nr:cysteine desulfurase family protein [Kineococcus sp. TRM81007]MCI2239979.1 cysteine desulfurase [Kineococcus sp. TRM81007]MCI3925716.1 cysteine desulfurase [Paenibacillus sp. TRM 82003]